MTDILTDWDRVRNALKRLNPQFHENDSSWAALDRIEAEVEQRKRLHEQDDALIVSLRAEVEQLREEKRVLAENETWAQAELREAKEWRKRALDADAEAERLRAEAEELRKSRSEYISRLADLTRKYGEREAEEKYDPGPGPEWERGPNMKDVG